VTWVRISDTWWRDTDALTLNPLARDLFVRLLSYCGGERNNGRLPRAAVTLVAGGGDETDSDLAELVSVVLLEADDHGWHVTEPDRYLFTEEQRAKKVEAGRLGGLATGRKKADAEANAAADAEADGQANGLAVPVTRFPLPESRNPDSRLPFPRGWESFAREEWQPLLEEWGKRFKLPPSGAEDSPGTQRSTLWAIVKNNPLRVAGWCRDSPRGASSYQVVAYIRKRYAAEDAA
jgi:hypothetical protein